jgi:hypothetical protein
MVQPGFDSPAGHEEDDRSNCVRTRSNIPRGAVVGHQRSSSEGADRANLARRQVMAEVALLEDLTEADEGSYYTIAGCGGDLAEWVAGYEEWLAAAEIGKPTAWYRVNGAQVNEFAGTVKPDDRFQPDVTMLLFPLDGLDVGKLAVFKLAHADRWFDDVIANMRPDVEDDD